MRFMILLESEFWSTMFAIAMRYLAPSTHAGARFLAGLRITSQCRSSISTNRFTQQLLVRMGRRLRYRSALWICILAPSSVLRRTGSTSKVENQMRALRRCSGCANYTNGRRRLRIHQSFSRRFVSILVHRRSSSLLQKVPL